MCSMPMPRLQAALRASFEVLGITCKTHGSLELSPIGSPRFEERQHAVAKPRWDALEARYKI